MFVAGLDEGWSFGFWQDCIGDDRQMYLEDCVRA